MNSYFTKTPNWIRSLYPKQVWNIPNKKKEIYLTFDDGPSSEITEWVLNTLRYHKAKATFFCIGKNIEKNPAVFGKIIEQGHAIGNHTYNHEKGWKTKSNTYLHSVIKTEETIKKTTNHKQLTTKLFRPPYGKIKKSQTRLLLKNNFKVIMWSVLSWDFDKSINAEQCLNNVVKNTKSGDIIVFHDSPKAIEKLKVVLPKVLEYFSEKEFVFERINL